MSEPTSPGTAPDQPATATTGNPDAAQGRATRRATRAVIAGRPGEEPGAGANSPIVLSSTYRAADGRAKPGDRVYGRWDNATWEALEEALGSLEGGTALAFGSGMAAISAVLDDIPVGGVVVAPRHAYAGTLGLLADLVARGRMSVRLVDIADTDEVIAASAGAHLLWVETPTNPILDVADLPALTEGAHRAGALVVVDSTLATPILQRPLEHGADVVVHSATKYLAGHSDVVLGAAVTATDGLHRRLLHRRTLGGAIPGPVEAWLALRGLRTLQLRVERAGANAAELARRLAGHPAVELVRHPSLPADPGHRRAARLLDGPVAVLSIEVTGGAEGAERVASAVRLWLPATSLGGVESSLERRRRHATEATTVPENLIRLSVGIEDVEDLWADLAQALDRAPEATGRSPHART